MKNPIVKFILLGTILYLGWYFFYELYLLPNTHFDEYLVNFLVEASEKGLQTLGFELRTFNDGEFKNHLAVINTAGVTIGAPCDGMILMALFVIFVVAFPGSWKNRMWFIPMGLILIQFFNIVRIISLALIVYWNEAYLSFNHDYTFTVFVYLVVFGLWWWWSKLNPATRAKSPSA